MIILEAVDNGVSARWFACWMVRGINEEVEKIRKGLNWMVRKEEINGLRRKKREVEKMRKGLSIIVGIAILLFAYSASATDVVTDGLVSWWKFEGNANDSWGTNHGTVTGAILTNETPGTASQQAYYFDGTGDYINCGSDSSLNPSDAMTIGAWVKYYDTGGEYYLARQYVGGKIAYALRRTAWGLIDGEWINEYHSNVRDGEWHHVVITYDKSLASENMKTYIDGEKDGTGTDYTNGLPSYTGDVYIGADYSLATWTEGIVDEVRIYNKALTLKEVQQNYNAIPEPSALLLLGGGLFGLLCFKRIKRR